MTKKPKLIYSIRAKLVSAVAMLLVAVIMVVSSTYAWFTLSTAPEVTGITTQIGANGALEMALLPLDGVYQEDSIKSAVGDGSIAQTLRNLTWGNLVDLSDASYGMDKIVLYPSALNLETDALGGQTIKGAPVQIPLYGPDGRITALDGTKTMTSVYDSQKQNFYAATDTQYGFRAIGAASGMTDLQLAYRDAKSMGANAVASAKVLASQVLNDNGSALANIAISYGMDKQNATFTGENVEALRALIDGTEKSVASVEKAYKLYIAAMVTSKLAQDAQMVESVALGIYEAALDDSKTASEVLAMVPAAATDSVSAIAANITSLNETKAQVAIADSKLQTLEATLETTPDATFTWDEISGAMTPMANTAQMKVNGFTVSEVKENLGDLVSSVTAQGGLVVTLSTGAGVFADIADHCGNFEASVTINEVEYNGIVLKNMAAKMRTETTLTTPYLDAIAVAAGNAGSPAGTSDQALPFSEFYGYVIDMAFRTNATESNLLLQTEAKDRIYGDNNNEETMGHGSSMTYTTLDPNFTPDQMAELMSCLRIVFFTPDTTGANMGKVLVYAKLNMEKKTVTGTEVSAPIMLYKVVDGEEVFLDGSENKAPVITALTQNTPTAVSVMVYLDGEYLTNADVSATVAQSMTGTMNLQFASSANLVPMENGNLHTPNGDSETTAAPTEPTNP